MRAGVPVVRPEDIETTARGAALAAGMGAGLWDASHFLASDVRAQYTYNAPTPTGSVGRASIYDIFLPTRGHGHSERDWYNFSPIEDDLPASVVVDKPLGEAVPYCVGT